MKGYPAPEGRFSLDDRLGELMAVPEGREMVKRVLCEAERRLLAQGKRMPKVSGVMLKMASGTRLSRIVERFGSSVPEEEIFKLNEELNKIEKPRKK